MNPTRACTVALCALTLAISVVPARTCDAQETGELPLTLVSVGGRYCTNAVTDKAGAMDRVDVFWSWRTPLAWEFTSGWDLGLRLNASIGALHGQDETGFVGTFVPTIAIGDTDNFFAFEAGAGLGLFTKWEYGTVEDFGGPVQFMLDLGFNFRVTKRLGLGYRIQHWSDASLWGTDNRGVEMHLFEITYRY
jgi:hypothetical protein